MSILEAIVLGVIEGVTEFLPISSTGHLTIAEELLGFDIDDRRHHRVHGDHPGRGDRGRGPLLPARTLGHRDRARRAGIGDREQRDTRDFRFGLAVAVGSIPIAVVGLALRDVIEGPLRSLWVVGAALIVWSFVMYAADRAYAARPEAERRARTTSACATRW